MSSKFYDNQNLRLRIQACALAAGCLAFCAPPAMANTLNAGDVVVLGWSEISDTVTFATLVEIPLGTVIKITDKGWDQATDVFTTANTGDGLITWTTSGTISAGTLFTLYLGGADGATVLTDVTHNTDLSAEIAVSGHTVDDPMGISGDGVFLYQDADTNPYFIFGFNNSAGTVDANGWNISVAATLRDSMLPDGAGSQNALINGTNAVGIPGGVSQQDNVQYTGLTSATNRAGWLARIANVSNWSGDNTGTMITSVGASAGSGLSVVQPNSAPTLSGGPSILSGTNENATSAGTMVSTILAGLAYADADPSALSGIAITAKTGTGTWQYSTDGLTWNGVGTVSGNSALLLSGSSQLRYVPNGQGGETATLTFRAWDQTSGTASSNNVRNLANTSTNGGSSAFSTGTVQASLTVSAVNHAPTITTSGGSASFIEGDNVASTPVAVDDGIVITDSDSPLLQSARVSITGGFLMGQDMLALVSTPATMGDITSIYNVSTGVLTLTSSAGATAAQWQAALRAVTYTNPVQSPNTSSRSVTFEVSDGLLSSSSVRLLAVNATNDSPVATVPGSIAVTEDVATAITGISFSDADAGSGSVTVTLGVGSGALSATSGGGVSVGGSASSLTLTGSTTNINVFIASSNVAFMPAANYAGQVTLTVSINDNGMSGGAAKTDSEIVTLNITGVNDAPVAVADAITVAEGGTATTLIGGATSVLANDSDVENDVLTAAVVSGPVNGTLTLNPNGTFSYTHNGSETTSDSFTYRAYDSVAGSNTVTVTITINPVNDAPVAVNDNATTDEYTWVTVAVRGNDTDAEGNALTVTGVTQGANGSAVIDAVTGNPIYTPNAGFTGVDHFTYTVDDGHGGTDTATVTVTVNEVIPVNHVPVAVADAVTVAEGGMTTILNGGATSLLVNDTDADGDPLDAVLVSGPSNGSLILNSNGTFNYTHNGSETTTDSFTYKVNDGTIDGNTVTVSITITPVNDAPVAVADVVTVAEGGTATTLTGGATSVLANDSDQENNVLSAVLVSGPANGSLIFHANGTFSYTHNGSETTTDSFTYKANDGTINGNTVTVSITITPVNDAPVAVADAITVAEGGTATTLTGGATSVLANDSDTENNTLAALLVSGPINGSLVLNANGTFSYVHNGSETTTDSFTYRPHDGTINGNTVTVTITITPVNDAPVVVADAITVAEGGTATTLTGGATSVLANDSDAEYNTLAAVLVSGPVNGSLIFHANGTFSYVHNGSETTTDSFTYKANDGTVDGNTVTVTITITPVNDAPVAVTDSITVAEGGTATTLTGGATSVLANDTDAENNMLSAVLVSGPANGTLTLNANGTFSYVHNGGETTADSFTYRANDGTTSGNTVTVSITITPVNDAPVAVNDTAELDANTSIAIAVRGNDTDADGNALTVIGATQGANGSVAIDAVTGNPIYTPNAGFAGNDSFTYTVDDGNGATATATVSVLVNQVSPVVTSVTSTSSNGSYKLGDTINVTVSFDQVVTVTGAPTLLLETGSVDQFATYASGSGSNTLTFTYLVQEGDVSLDLDYASTVALAFNGGSIRNSEGDIAILTLATPGAAGSLGANKALVIDGVPPVVSTPIADQTMTIGDADVVIDLEEHFTDANSTLTYAVVSNADSGKATASISGTQLTLHAVANGVTTITVSASDGINTAVQDVFQVAVGTATPTPLALSTAITLNRANGLGELSVKVANTTAYPINGFRLNVDFSSYVGAHPTLRLSNASGNVNTATPYIDYPYPLALGQEVTLKLQFYTQNRSFPNPFAPVLTTETLAASQVPHTNGNGVQPVIKITENGLLVEFPSVPGHWYRVRYSHDMTNWYDSPVPVQAGGTKTQWLDSGAPFTMAPPLTPEVPTRIYRVNEIAAP